jgi:hypothetical protein
MIVYHVWFSFKSGSNEAAEIAKARTFLDDLRDRAKLLRYRLLKNRAVNEKTRLCPYQLMAEFENEDQFGRSFADVHQTGVHAGKHGAMIENVDQFIVEVFQDLD